MSFTEPGVIGAYRATWRKANPRALLQDIIREHPTAEKDEILRLFLDEGKPDEDIVNAVFLYWFDNNWRSLFAEMRTALSGAKPAGVTAGATPEAAGNPSQPSAASSTRSRIHAKISERIQYETKLMLLELVMPNGKQLAACTGPECASFGSWFARLADKTPDGKTVGAALTEDQVRALWRSAEKSAAKPAKK
jgi:hypothetical protein